MLSKVRVAFGLLAIAVLSLLLGGCGGGGGGGGGGTTGSGGTSGSTLAYISVTPGLPANLALGLTQQFTATATYVNNTTNAVTNVDVTSTATWASSNTAAATIGATGLAKSVGVGTTNITASLNGVTSFNTVTLNVIAAQLTSVAISPTSASLAAGQSQQFKMTGSYTDGTTQDLTASAFWSSNNAAATVAAGLVFGQAPSATPATVTASYNSMSITAQVTVSNYSIGGTVNDLPVGSSVTIQNGADMLTIAGNGATPVRFIFPTGVAAGGTYNVTVATQPAGTVHSCTVVDGSGPITSNFISFVKVVCGPAVGTIAGGLSVVPDPNVPGTTTLIAPGTGGHANGTGMAVLFTSPSGIAYDTLGNLYVADTGNSVIRKVTAAGLVSDYAGSTAVGSTNNTNPLLATFSFPSDVALDTSNNVYVADTGNGLIRKINASTGAVTTYAGAGGVGSTNSTNPLLATFNYPQGLAVDSTGNVYVADTSNNMIRKIATTGAVTTFAGSTTCTTLTNGTGTAACFNLPSGIVVDKTGTYLYVADSGNAAVRRITIATQAVTTLAGTTGGYLDGACSTAMFTTPKKITVDAANNIYVADIGGSLIRKIVGANTTSCTVSTLAGLVGATSFFRDGSAIGAMLPTPQGIAVDGSNNVFFTDTSNQLLRKYIP